MNNETDELNNLFKLLEPEINDFVQLIKDMALIDSPYKGEFNFMKSMVRSEKFRPNLEGRVQLLIKELNCFEKLYENIVEDDEVCELYVKSGLLDKSVELRKRIISKL